MLRKSLCSDVGRSLSGQGLRFRAHSIAFRKYDGSEKIALRAHSGGFLWDNRLQGLWHCLEDHGTE